MALGMEPGQGMDIEGQIRDGVAAFMQSQDPAIAVEVVTMMAEMMGIAPEIDPFAGDQDMAPAPEQVPMGRNGMRLRMFRKGGRVNDYKVPSYRRGGGGPGSPDRGLSNQFVDPNANPVRPSPSPASAPDLQIDTFGTVTDQSMRQPETDLPPGLTIPGGYTLEDLGLAGRRGSPLTQELINYRFGLKRQNAATIKNTPSSYIDRR